MTIAVKRSTTTAIDSPISLTPGTVHSSIYSSISLFHDVPKFPLSGAIKVLVVESKWNANYPTYTIGNSCNRFFHSCYPYHVICFSLLIRLMSLCRFNVPQL